jgi:plastin-1
MNLVVNAAKAIGCSMVNIGSEDLMAGKETLILGLIWQIVKLQLLRDISLEDSPFLVRLLSEGEEVTDLKDLPAEQLLLRWFNHHLEQAGSDRRVKNFGKDLQDSEAYSVLLHQLQPESCDEVTETDPRQRAAHVIANAKKMDVPAFIHPADICKPNAKVGMVLFLDACTLVIFFSLSLPCGCL